MGRNRFVAVLREHWRRPGGYRELLAVAVPLVLSTGAWSVQHFVDRMYLTWYSPETIAAAMPAGLLNFTVLALFIGTAGYVNTFVAQYYGAERPHRIGPSVWQGIYVAVIAGAVHLALIPLAGGIFSLIGHAPAVAAHEVVYFRLLCLGAFPVTASSALSSFFSGRGRPWPIVWVNAGATLVNIVLDYLLVFGRFGFPEMGITGAGIATVLAGCSSFVFFMLILARRSYRERYDTIGGWRPDRALFMRLIRFGLPNGVQFLIDVAGFTVFILLIGRLGTIELAATNIAFNINTLAFMPMIGSGMAVSVLVGQYLGRNDPALAERSVWSGFTLTFVYMASVAALYVLTPDLFILPYAARADAASFPEMRRLVIVLLRFVAVYSLFDGMNLIFAFAIKGAGDTRYVMRMIIVLSAFVLTIPSIIAYMVLDASLYTGWTIVTVYVCLLGVMFLLRFLGGKWKTMRVIEHAPPIVPHSLPEAPIGDVEL